MDLKALLTAAIAALLTLRGNGAVRPEHDQPFMGAIGDLEKIQAELAQPTPALPVEQRLDAIEGSLAGMAPTFAGMAETFAHFSDMLGRLPEAVALELMHQTAHAAIEAQGDKPAATPAAAPAAAT